MQCHAWGIGWETLTDDEPGMRWPRPRQHSHIFKAPLRTVGQALIQVCQHRGHAIERCVDEHGLKLDFEPTSFQGQSVRLHPKSCFSHVLVLRGRKHLLERLAMERLPRHLGHVHSQ